ncbi:unnamed protein product [Mytilus edulis]|uniref:C-type lectin domain-containing protein n=1 Tax=Mytilus edulis TaxID=6550 RepID=A0A8S3TK55_MYTED|nr:unnamed protein product [Mytilus edulis]
MAKFIRNLQSQPDNSRGNTVTPDSSTLIDHVYVTNKDLILESHVVKFSISDHYPAKKIGNMVGKALRIPIIQSSTQKNHGLMLRIFQDFCKSNLGAYLAEITTPEENDFLMNLLPKPTVDNRVEVWLGARDLKRDGEFTWDNSATYLDYTDWGPKEPNGWYIEDCLATHLYRDGKLHWNDRACAARNFFVCEKSVGTVGSGEKTT